jgi:hypothetical protein
METSTVAPWPCLNDFYVVWGSAVDSCHACVHISQGFRCQNRSVDVSAPLYVVPKSTPTISLSCAGLGFSSVFTAGMGPWFALGSKATGMLPDLPLNALAMLCFLSILSQTTMSTTEVRSKSDGEGYMDSRTRGVSAAEITRASQLGGL